MSLDKHALQLWKDFCWIMKRVGLKDAIDTNPYRIVTIQGLTEERGFKGSL